MLQWCPPAERDGMQPVLLLMMTHALPMLTLAAAAAACCCSGARMLSTEARSLERVKSNFRMSLGIELAKASQESNLSGGPDNGGNQVSVG